MNPGRDSVDAMKVLIAAGIRPDDVTFHTDNALHVAARARSKQRPAVLRYLLVFQWTVVVSVC